MAHSLVATVAVATPVPGDRGASNIAWNPPTLHLLLNDAYGLCPAFAFDAMRREVENIFAQNGLSIRVHLATPGQALTEFPEPRVNAILVPAEAELWNLGKNAMAAGKLLLGCDAVGTHGGLPQA